MKRKNKFGKSLIEAVDRELKRIFGEVATLVIYGYLESNLSLKQEEIPEKIEVFVKGLNSFLNSGARVVERIILENLYAIFGFEYKVEEGRGFVDSVRELKNRLKSVESNSSVDASLKFELAEAR